MLNFQCNLEDYKVSLKNEGKIKMFPAKKKLFVNERISLKEKTEENTSGRSKMIPDGNTEIKQEMKISEQYKHIAKYKWILIVINNIKYVLW